MTDLIIRGGYVIDPSQDLEGTMDVEIRQDRVPSIAPYFEPRVRQTLNVRRTRSRWPTLSWAKSSSSPAERTGES